MGADPADQEAGGERRSRPGGQGPGRDLVRPVGRKATFSDYFEKQWLPNRRGEKNTKAAYLSHYNSSLKAAFGHLELRRILPSTVHGWVSREIEAGATPGTVVAKFKTLQTCLAGRRGASAMRDGLIATNPCYGTEFPTVPRREVQICEPDEVDRLIEALPKGWRLLPLLPSETWLRWGELMGLRVKRFTLGYRTLRVRETVLELTRAQTDTLVPAVRGRGELSTRPCAPCRPHRARPARR